MTPADLLRANPWPFREKSQPDAWTAFNTKFGGVKQDELWKSAVEASGGRFYVAAEEKDILDAVHDIDRLSPGKINVREYTSQEPRFSGYALIAVALWLTAGLMKVGVPYFRTFP